MKKIFIALLIASFFVSCGSAPAGDGTADESGVLNKNDAASEASFASENIISSDEDVAEYSDGDSDGDEDGGGDTESNEVAAIDEEEDYDDEASGTAIDDGADASVAASNDSDDGSGTDAAADEADGFDAASGDSASDVAFDRATEDEIVQIDEDGVLNADIDQGITDELPELEFDEDGRAVVVTPDMKNWSEPIANEGAIESRVADSPKLSTEEERLLETMYDENFNESEVALAPLPPPNEEALPTEQTANTPSGDAVSSAAPNDNVHDAAVLDDNVYDVAPPSADANVVASASAAYISSTPAAPPAPDAADSADVPAPSDIPVTTDAPVSTTPSASANTPADAAPAVADASPANAASPLPVIASGAQKNEGEKSLDLPILPKTADSDTKPSEVFVTEYNPAESTEDENKTDEANDGTENEIKPSRSVEIKNHQYLDVTYPGAGWVYMGEGVSKGKKIAFKGRKLGETQTQFTLRAQRTGTALLHFYKNDVLSGNYIDDYMEVVVTDEVASTTDPHAKAPDYADVVPPRPKKAKTVQVAEKDKEESKADNAAEDKASNELSIKADNESVAALPKADEAKTQVAREESTKEDSAKAGVAKARTAKPQASKAQVKKAEATKTAAKEDSAKPKASSAQAAKAQSSTLQRQGQETKPKAQADVAMANAPKAAAQEVSENPSSQVPMSRQTPHAQEQEDKRAPLASPFSGGTEGASVSNASLKDIGDESADSLLLAAQKAYNGKRYADCLTLLSAFFDKATSRIDEALYLEGLSLEARSPAQNIKGAIDTYSILMKNWPASKLWNKARERSIYLKRMYIDIR